MTSGDAIRAAIQAHVAAVGTADPGALAALYAADGRLYDPAGSEPVVGRTAIGEYFASVLSEPREMEVVAVAVTGLEAAVHFRATPADGHVRDVIDTMTFNERGLIVAMRAYADWDPDDRSDLAPRSSARGDG
jgi:steroid delta-isomerase